MIKIARERAARVADVMNDALVVLDMRMTLDVAARILAERRISGAPVVSASGRPIGVVSHADLLDPRHQGPDSTVEKAMTKVLYAVRPSDPAMMAVRLMVKENIHRVIVVDDQNGKLLGIVTAMDILRAVARSEPEENVEVEFIRIG
jgi:predicted transcriptional regulator